MHMGESKQQPRALPGGNNGPHTAPTRAPDFITGLSIPPHRPPPAWELWDLGQAAAADRSSLTRRSRQTCEHRGALTPPPHTSTGRRHIRDSFLEVGWGAVFGGGGARSSAPSGWRKRPKEEKLHGSCFLLVLQFVRHSQKFGSWGGSVGDAIGNISPATVHI